MRSRSTRRTATVTTSAPDASIASHHLLFVRYLPVPPSAATAASRPAMMSGADRVDACAHPPPTKCTSSSDVAAAHRRVGVAVAPQDLAVVLDHAPAPAGDRVPRASTVQPAELPRLAVHWTRCCPYYHAVVPVHVARSAIAGSYPDRAAPGSPSSSDFRRMTTERCLPQPRALIRLRRNDDRERCPYHAPVTSETARAPAPARLPRRRGSPPRRARRRRGPRARAPA